MKNFWINEDLRIPMKDGIELSSKVWMPKITNKKRLPAIIEYIPYRKRDGTIFRDELIHPYFANNGYIAIRIDMRGSGDSDGVMHDEYTFQEQDDAITAIKWIANQDLSLIHISEPTRPY